MSASDAAAAVDTVPSTASSGEETTSGVEGQIVSVPPVTRPCTHSIQIQFNTGSHCAVGVYKDLRQEIDEAFEPYSPICKLYEEMDCIEEGNEKEEDPSEATYGDYDSDLSDTKSVGKMQMQIDKNEELSRKNKIIAEKNDMIIFLNKQHADFAKFFANKIEGETEEKKKLLECAEGREAFNAELIEENKKYEEENEKYRRANEQLEGNVEDAFAENDAAAAAEADDADAADEADAAAAEDDAAAADDAANVAPAEISENLKKALLDLQEVVGDLEGEPPGMDQLLEWIMVMNDNAAKGKSSSETSKASQASTPTRIRLHPGCTLPMLFSNHVKQKREKETAAASQNAAEDAEAAAAAPVEEATGRKRAHSPSEGGTEGKKTKTDGDDSN